MINLRCKSQSVHVQCFKKNAITFSTFQNEVLPHTPPPFVHKPFQEFHGDLCCLAKTFVGNPLYTPQPVDESGNQSSKSTIHTQIPTCFFLEQWSSSNRFTGCVHQLVMTKEFKCSSAERPQVPDCDFFPIFFKLIVLYWIWFDAKLWVIW